MDAIERAIRNALEKGPSGDRVFREKVYRQAFGALERALQANPSVTVETAIRRRKGLQEKITEIESEYLPALPPMPETPSEELAAAQAAPVIEVTPSGEAAITIAPAVDSPSAAPGVTGDSGLEFRQVQAELTVEELAAVGSPAAPSIDPIPVAPDIRVETESGATPVVPDIMVENPPIQREPMEPPPTLGEVSAVKADADLARAEKRRPFAAIFLGVTLICAAAIGLWWAVQTGLLNPPSQEMTGIEEAPADTEDFEPGADAEPIKPGQADLERQWIVAFTPGEPSTVSAPGDTKAEVVQEPSGQFMRIQSGASGSAIIFDIGQGVLEQIAGKKATFDIVARAQEGQETQMSIDCNFGELGDCGRKRYAVGTTRADYLFEIDMPAGTPGAGGTIAINPDFSNSGKAVDIFEIKVSVAP
ncbi:MAG: hypothetical protein AB7P20_12655 [Rhizobiaceae bacterium]